MFCHSHNGRKYLRLIKGFQMFTPENYTIIAIWFPKLLGLIYLAAFGAFIFQIKGLMGINGILPIARYLELVKKHYKNKSYRIFPTLFWINSSDAALISAAIAGSILSIGLILGVFPSLTLFLLYILYLSIVSAGQEFLSFGWEGFLLEITINTFFLSLTSPPNLMVWISINVLLFRFHLQAGAVKLQSRDANWRNLTALAYHYQSQPIPNMAAWYAHKLPMWFHKLSTLLMFIIELVICFGIFGNEPIRLFVFTSFFGLQFTIWLTGNFSYLNHLTAVFSTILIGNIYLSWLGSPSEVYGNPFTDMICTIAGTTLTILQITQLWQHFVPNPLFGQWLRALSPFHIVNAYGIFAIMTTTRHEIVFEGSDDGEVWKEYLFYHKPSEITRRPRRISPYQPRIDWQAWFLPLGSYRYDTWFDNFIYHLLKGSKPVTALLRYNPFPDTPPKYVRTVLYEYQFSSFKEKREHGWWWRRTYHGVFTHPVGLS